MKVSFMKEGKLVTNDTNNYSNRRGPRLYSKRSKGPCKSYNDDNLKVGLYRNGKRVAGSPHYYKVRAHVEYPEEVDQETIDTSSKIYGLDLKVTNTVDAFGAPEESKSKIYLISNVSPNDTDVFDDVQAYIKSIDGIDVSQLSIVKKEALTALEKIANEAKQNTTDNQDNQKLIKAKKTIRDYEERLATYEHEIIKLKEYIKSLEDELDDYEYEDDEDDASFLSNRDNKIKRQESK